MNGYHKHVDDPLHAGWVHSAIKEHGVFRGWKRWHKEGMFIDYNHPDFRGKWVACSYSTLDWYPLGAVKNLKEAIEVTYAMERIGPYAMDDA